MRSVHISAMTLDEYIRSTGTTEAAIAAAAGCSQGSVNKVRNGIINPTFDLLRRISEATGGQFKPGDFEPKSSAPRVEAAE